MYRYDLYITQVSQVQELTEFKYIIVMTDKNIVQETFPVLGMSCASCAARIEKTLNRQSGVKIAAVNYASATATVEYDPKNCSSEALQQAVQAAGYDLLINRDGNTLEEAEEAHNKNSLH